MLTLGGHRARRLPIRARVVVSDGASTFAAEVLNISLGGAFLAMPPRSLVDPLAPGIASVSIDRGISFWLDLPPAPILVRGYVRWTRSLVAGPGSPVGFGMEFYDPDGQLAAYLTGAFRALEDTP